MTVRWVDAAPSALRAATVVDLRDETAALVVLDASGAVVAADPAVERLLGVPDLLGLTLDQAGLHLTGTDGLPLDAADDPLQRAFGAGMSEPPRVVGVESGTEATARFAWVELGAEPVVDDEGRLAGITTTWREVTVTPQGRAATAALVRALRAASRAAVADEARFRALAAAAADVVLQSDIAGRCTWVSPSVTDVLGWPADQVVGASLLPLVHPDDRERANEQRRRSLAAGDDDGAERLEVRYATSEGGWRWMSATSRTLRDPHGRVIGGITALRDIQPEVDRREQQRVLTGHDGLTGLLDRDAVVHRLVRDLHATRGTGRLVGVLHIDLDGFRAVNDTLGLDTGDAVLVAVAGRLRRVLRDSDAVARLGGDQFLVVLPSLHEPSDAHRRAAALLAAVAETPAEDGLPPVTASIGVACDDGSGEATGLIREAGAGLRRAKEAGGAQVSL